MISGRAEGWRPEEEMLTIGMPCGEYVVACECRWQNADYGCAVLQESKCDRFVRALCQLQECVYRLASVKA